MIKMIRNNVRKYKNQKKKGRYPKTNRAGIIYIIFFITLIVTSSTLYKKVYAKSEDKVDFQQERLTLNTTEEDHHKGENAEDSESTKISLNEDTIDSYTNDLDYTDIQKVIDDIVENEKGFNFGDYVNRLVTGQEPFSISGIFSKLKSSVVGEIDANINVIIQLVGLAIVAAIFTNFSGIFQNNQVAETGFYITYLLLFTMLTASFYSASTVASNTLETIMNFMKALIPTYFLSITFAAGANTSLVFYESTLFLITLVDFILVRILLPMINIYLLVSLANNLSKEDLLSKLAELLEFLVSGALKGLLAIVIGFNTIQGLIVPVADSVKNSLLLRATSALPGVGNSFEAVTKTVLGAGVLVKNSIGVAGLIVIIIICAVPVIKLAIITIIYKIGVAVVQPISEKRILNCISATAGAAKMLLQVVAVGAVLFMLTITIIIASTNLKLFR